MNLLPFIEQADGLLLKVKVIPKASSNRIGEFITLLSTVRLKIYITAAPEDGKANKAVIALLSKHFNLAKKNFSIEKGFSVSEKSIKILGDPKVLYSTLTTYFESFQ